MYLHEHPVQIVQNFKSKEHTVEYGNTACSIDDPELIPREVLDVVASIRVALEIKFGEKKCALKLKFTGRIKPCLSWTQRADVICFALHPGFANGDIFLCC